MVFLTRSLRFIYNPVFRKWYFSLEGYNRWGLYHDDIMLNHDLEDYKEALRRLPPNLYDEHCFRLVRASQLELTKAYLPKEEWPTFEEDQTKGRFLQPYLREIEAERKEKQEWAKFLAK